MVSPVSAYKRDPKSSVSLFPAIICECSPSSISFKRHTISFQPVSSTVLPTFDGKTDLDLKGSPAAHQRKNTFRNLAIRRTKKRIIAVTLANAAVSWLVTLVAYFVMADTDAISGGGTATKAIEKAIVIFLSLLQVALVVTYWKLRKRYWFGIDATHRVGRVSLLSLSPFPRSRSPFPVYKCILECALHLAVFPPNITAHFSIWVNGVYSDCSMDDLLFILMFMRNYHSIEAVYWCTLLPDARSHFIAKLVGVRVTKIYLYRCFMTMYIRPIVIAVVSLIVLLPGIIEYLFANISEIQQFYTIWTEYWIISVTQAPVGYGDSSSDTLFGKLSLLMSCFTGLILLGMTTSVSSSNLKMSLKECSLYSELLYTREKRRYEVQAGTLIQRWWKFMRMREGKKRKSRVIVEFYQYLGKYKKVIIECQRLRYYRFERAITALELFVHNTVRPLKDYLTPLRSTYETVMSLPRPKT